jgi:hypothetical protein
MSRKNRRERLSRIMGRLLFFSLVLSVIYAIIRLHFAPSEGDAQLHQMSRSDYALILLQCLLGLIVMGLPTILTRKWSLPVPSIVYILYYVFLYCAIFLGEVMAFYYIIPHWDTILHAFSGAMLGALGFILVDWLNDSPAVRVHLSPLFVSLFAFCFALAAGAVWEIYEFLGDGLFGLNMQKYMSNGVMLVGHEALSDTMKDIIVDALSAAAISIVGYFSIRKKKVEDVSVEKTSDSSKE